MSGVRFTVNSREVAADVEPRTHLGDFLRDHLRLTGTHLACEQGVCGTCTVLVDAQPTRACLVLAAACDGCEIVSIEGFGEDEVMRALRRAFTEAHGLQCGFCTAGFLMTILSFLEENSNPNEQEIREAISGNICRCTGYQHIVDAVKLAAEKMTAEGG